MITVYEKKNKLIYVYKKNKLAKIFYPEFDLNKTINLLKEINQLRDSKNKNIYSAWSYKEYFFYPAIQEWIFYDYLVGVVTYNKAFKYLNGKKFKIVNEGPKNIGRFEKSYNFLYKRKTFLTRIIYNILTYLISFNTSLKDKILLSDDGVSGFRYKKLQTILKRHSKYLRLEKLNSLSSIKKFKFTNNTNYYHGKLKLFFFKNNFNPHNVSNEIKSLINDREFNLMLEAIDIKCKDLIKQTIFFTKKTKIHKPRVLFCYDQIETIIPIIVAFKINKIMSFSYQHGPITKYHAGWIGYNMPRNYCNITPDKIILWGEYWREYLINISNKYSYNNIMIGGHLNKQITYEEKFFSNKDEINTSFQKKLKFLLPYEFLADNSEISKFLEKLISYNIEITIKLRPDSDIDVDPLSYSQIVIDNCNFVTDLKDNEIEKFDIVMFTQSIYALELMRFGVNLWFLETSFNFLEQIAENKFAHYIRLNELDGIIREKNRFKKYLTTLYTFKDYKHLFSDEKLDNTIKGVLSDYE